MTVMVELSGVPERSVEVPITASGEGGVSESDYSGVPTTVRFGAAETTARFTFRATGDSVDDDGHSVVLGFGDLPAAVSEGSRATAVVSITDDDDPSVAVSFVEGSFSVLEGSSVTVMVELSGVPERSVEVPITASGEGGVSESDYSGVPTTVRFGAAETSARFMFRVTDDSVDDDGHSVVLGFGDLPAAVSEGSRATTTVNIGDDDMAGVTVSESALTVDECGIGVYTVVLDSEPTAAVTVTVGGHSGTDVVVSPAVLTFSAGDWDTVRTVTVTAVEDDDAVPDASVALTHTVAGHGEYAGVTASGVVVTIVENDASVLSVSGADGSEADGELVFAVSISAAAGGEVTVDYATSDATAKAGEDYTFTSGTLTFAAGSTAAATIRVPVADDTADEDEEETLNLTLSNAQGASLAGGGSSLTVIGTITDNDDPSVTVSFVEGSFSVLEGSSVTVMVELSGVPERSVEVPITASGEGGVSESDYSGVPTTVRFGAAETSARFMFRATDDSVDDDGHSVVLGFGDLPAAVSEGSRATTTVNITDDDDPIDTTDAVSVDFLDFRLSCPSEMAEGETYTCSLSNTADAEGAWPAVGLLHSSGDSDRALVAGGPLDVRFCTVAAAPCEGNLLAAGDIRTSNWWLQDELIGYSRFDWSGNASALETRSFFVSVVDDDEYEPQQVFYIGVIAGESQNISALYNNKSEITVLRSDSRSSDASLSELRLSMGAKPIDFEFSSRTYSYSVDVPYHVTELVVVPVAAHERAAVTVDGNPVAPPVGDHRSGEVLPLGIGSTVVSVVATAEDGIAQHRYTVDINRLDNGEQDVVEVVSGVFSLTCPEAVQEGTQHSCTLRNDSAVAEEWPVVSVIHSSLDEDRAMVAAAGSGTGGSSDDRDVRLWPDGGSSQDAYNHGYGELFLGSVAANRIVYGYQKFDLSGEAGAGEERAVHLYGEENDDGPASSEVFYISIAADGYTGLSGLVGNKAPIILNERDGAAGDGAARGRAGNGAAGDGAAAESAESPAVESLTVGETAASWASVTTSVANQASAEVTVHVRHRPSDATGSAGWTSVSAQASAGSAEVALWGLEPSTAYRVQASLDPAFPPSSTRFLVLTTPAAPTVDFASEEFALRPSAFVWLLGNPLHDRVNSTYDRDAQVLDDSRYFDIVRVDSANVAAEDIEFSVEEIPDRVPYQFCWFPDKAPLEWEEPDADSIEPFCADLDLDVLSSSGLLYMFVDGPDADAGKAFRADLHIADYPAQRMRLSAQDTNSGLKTYREVIVRPPALEVGCDDYPDSNWERYNCLFNGERPNPPSTPADQAMIDALPADLAQARDNYTLVFREEFDTDSRCEDLATTLDDDVWFFRTLDNCESKPADTNGKRCVGIENGHYYLSVSKLCRPAEIRTSGKMEFRYGYVEVKYRVPIVHAGFWHNMAVVFGDSRRSRKYSLQNYAIHIDGSTASMMKALSLEVDFFEYVPTKKSSVSHQYVNYHPISALGEIQPQRTSFRFDLCGPPTNQWAIAFRPNNCETNSVVTIVKGLEWTPRGYRLFLTIEGIHSQSAWVVPKDNIQVSYVKRKNYSTPENPVYGTSWYSYTDAAHSAWFEYLDPDDSDSILEQLGVAHVPLDIRISAWGYPRSHDLLHVTKLEIDYIRVFQPADGYATMEPVYQ